MVKGLPANAGDVGSIPGSERSPGEGSGYPLLQNRLDKGAWWVTVHGIAKESDGLAVQQWQQQQICKDVEQESVRTPWRDLCFLSFSVEGSPESLENEDFSSSSAITVFKDTSQGAVDQLSLILSPEHQISQKFYIPRSTATAALGAAARLATSKSLLHWYPSVKKMETWGRWGGKSQPET